MELQQLKTYLCGLIFCMPPFAGQASDMGKILILTLLIVLIAVLLLGIRVFFVKGGKFPDTHIDANKALRDKGIHCAAHEDTLARRKRGI